MLIGSFTISPIFQIILFIFLIKIILKKYNNYFIDTKKIFIINIIMLILILIIINIDINFLYLLLMPFIVILILIILNLLFHRLFNCYKKEENEKNVITKVIINYLIIYILIFLESSILISLIYFIVLIFFVVFYKIYHKKFNLFKSIIISISPIIAIYLFFFVGGKISTAIEWNKIKGDYEVINERILEYKNNVCQINDCERNNYIDSIYLDKESEKIKFNKNEIKSIDKIKKYYSYQEEVYIYNNYIEYRDESGRFQIIYSINKKKPVVIGADSIEYLGNNWYKVWLW